MTRANRLVYLVYIVIYLEGNWGASDAIASAVVSPVVSGETLANNTQRHEPGTNKCHFKNGGCQYRCVDTPDSYICRCPRGFKLANDKHRCDDINECAQSSPGCDSMEICVNNWGSYDCIASPDSTANPGYQWVSQRMLLGLTIWLALLTLLAVVITLCVAVRVTSRSHDSPVKEVVSLPTSLHRQQPIFYPHVEQTTNKYRRQHQVRGEVNPAFVFD